MADLVTGIDHILVGVRDLEAARKVWSRLGFTCTARGSHIQWGTANYCIMFPRDYVELIGIVDSSKFVNNLDRFLETGEGMLGISLHSADMDTTRSLLTRLAIESDGPSELARNLELPEGTVRPRFRLLFTPPEATPGLRVFITQHLTPGMIRRPEWLEHANGATGLAGVTAMVDDPAALAAAWRTLLGDRAVKEAPGALDVRVTPHTLRFLGPAAARETYGSLLPEAPLPRVVSQTVLVRDIAAAARCLDGNGVRYRRPADDVLRIAPAEATGVILDLAGV